MENSPQRSNVTLINPQSAWHLVIRHGNAQFEQGRFQRAHCAYIDALALAHAHLREWQCVDDAFGAVVVSTLNLAATEVALNELQMAASELCRVHEWLIDIARSCHLPTDSRLAALKQVNRTFVELKRFQSTHGQFSEIEYWLHNSCTCGVLEECSGISQTRH